ncbi:MAG: proline--tRNA ligase [Pseudomonadota bacterium]
MRASQLLMPTMKEDPADADIASHRLMLRAGLIRQVASGIYNWLPLGVRVLHKIEAIVREELHASGAQEVLMPVVQPATLWRESGRWDVMGPELARLIDRHDNEFCLSPTQEEVITDLVRREIQSYRELPRNLFQIQTKFRDEIRPRFGVMRSREFIMKDGYSFHIDQDSMDETYRAMYDCYSRILERLGLEFRAVEADSGNIGGDNSHEFQVLADSGEDTIAYSTVSDYAANLEKATTVFPSAPAAPGDGALAKVATPDARTIAAVAELLDVPATSCVKTLFVEGEDGGPIGLILRGDHELNELKAQKLPGVAAPLRFADPEDLRGRIGAGVGSLGPVGLSLPMLVDHSAAQCTDFVCGANEDGFHYTGANWGRDVALDVEAVVDLRNVVPGDPSPDGQGELAFTRGIEIGHIFQLGKKYSDTLGASVLSQEGREETLLMGCYGIGITRMVAAIIEQKHDEQGICWPEAVAPADVHIVALNYHKSDAVRAAADQLYADIHASGRTALLDDRPERPGVKFADADLIGLPHRITVGDRGLKNNEVEYRRRIDADNVSVALGDVLQSLDG